MLDKLKPTPKPAWTSFENATKDDFLAVMEYDEAYANAVADRLLAALKDLAEEDTPLSDQPLSALAAVCDACPLNAETPLRFSMLPPQPPPSRRPLCTRKIQRQPAL